MYRIVEGDSDLELSDEEKDKNELLLLKKTEKAQKKRQEAHQMS